MTTAVLPSARPASAGPRPLRWTCAEFHRFGDMGVFEGRRAMLINGVILEEGPMNPPHAITLGGTFSEARDGVDTSGTSLTRKRSTVLRLRVRLVSRLSAGGRRGRLA